MGHGAHQAAHHTPSTSHLFAIFLQADFFPKDVFIRIYFYNYNSNYYYYYYVRTYSWAGASVVLWLTRGQQAPLCLLPGT